MLTSLRSTKTVSILPEIAVVIVTLYMMPGVSWKYDTFDGWVAFITSVITLLCVATDVRAWRARAEGLRWERTMAERRSKQEAAQEYLARKRGYHGN